MALKNNVLTYLGVGAACVACCAPLIAPLLFGAGTIGVGTSVGLSLDQAICGGIAAAALGGFSYWLWRNQQKAKAARSCGCDTACDARTCAPSKPT